MKPRMFIGSSVEGLEIAEAIQQNLAHDIFCTLWTQGVFNLSSYTLDALLKEFKKNDYGVFVFSPSDVAKIRSKQFQVVRDNVIFEAGLFMGKHGKGKCFIVIPRGIKGFHLPTDLLGLKPAEYDPDQIAVSNPMAALGAACSEIKRSIKP